MPPATGGAPVTAPGRRSARTRPAGRSTRRGWSPTPLVMAGSVALFGLDHVLGVIAGRAQRRLRRLLLPPPRLRRRRRPVGGAPTSSPPTSTWTAGRRRSRSSSGARTRVSSSTAWSTALLALDYPADRMTLVVVDDGSDRRHRCAARRAGRRGTRGSASCTGAPGAGGGKSGALNDALAGVDAEVAVVFDADHEPDPTTLRRLVRHFRDPAGRRGDGPVRHPQRFGLHDGHARSSSTSSPVTSSTSSAGRRCSSCPPTGAPTARCG